MIVWQVAKHQIRSCIGIAELPEAIPAAVRFFECVGKTSVFTHHHAVAGNHRNLFAVVAIINGPVVPCSRDLWGAGGKQDEKKEYASLYGG